MQTKQKEQKVQKSKAKTKECKKAIRTYRRSVKCLVDKSCCEERGGGLGDKVAQVVKAEFISRITDIPLSSILFSLFINIFSYNQHPRLKKQN